MAPVVCRRNEVLQSHIVRGSSRAPWRVLFLRKGEPAWLIYRAYRQYGYRLAEIADYLGVHAATVSRRLKRGEQANV